MAFCTFGILLSGFVLLIKILNVFSSSPTPDRGTGEASTSAPSGQSDPLLVQTKYGQVRGLYSGEGVRVFHGVPYAESPTGDKRWQPPVELAGWPPGVLDATKKRPGCPQGCDNRIYCTNTTSEDCLFLEIYTPTNVTFPVPVFVYLHGGSFDSVTTTLPIFDCTRLVQRSGAIAVLVEYRIGVIGFLVTGEKNKDAKGNYGILDQRLAMKWVKENIASFGGDPDKVTLAGQSAGAQSVFIHLVSEESGPYFNSVIVESPPLTVPFATYPEATNRGRAVARLLGCLDNSTFNMSCLRSKTPADIIRAQSEARSNVLAYRERIEPFAPVVDGKIVKTQTLEAVYLYATSGNATKPIICSYTLDDALIHVHRALSFPVSEVMYQFIMSTALANIPTEVTKLYPVTNTTDVRDDLSVALTDALFRCPLRRVARILAEIAGNSHVYLYQWAKGLDLELPPEFKPCTGRPCHMAQVIYVFQNIDNIPQIDTTSSSANHTSVKPSASDLRASNFIVSYYINFIKFGNPNGQRTPEELTSNGSSQAVNDRSQSTLIPWPAVKTTPRSDLPELVFTPKGQLEVFRKPSDVRCVAWDKAGYFL